ncbi:MAG: VOC family protein [Bacteroidales bacterium]|nr:VOC family protein [Bacteroidales bacterium]
MNQRLACVTLVIDDYDRAIDYYTRVLNFELVEDTVISEHKRWVLVRPKGSGSCSLLLARAANQEQQKYIGNQTGGRVFLFLNTDNFERDYSNLIENNVTIVREPRDEPYGRVAVFSDIYGNLWDLIEPVGKQLPR